LRRPQEGDVAKVTVLVVGYRFGLLSTFSLLLLDSPSASCGGWNRTSGLQVQSLASLPAATAPQRRHFFGDPLGQQCSGRRTRTFIACFKGRKPTVSRSPSTRCFKVPSQSALRELNPSRRLGRPAPCRSAKGTLCSQASCGGRNRTCVRAVNSRLPVPTQTPPQSHS
jgi:hypothetical protein